MNRVYILYDSRAAGGNGTDDAQVMVACDSEAEAKHYRGEHGAVACYSYAKDGQNLVDERWEWDWWPQARPQKKRRQKSRSTP